MMVPSSAIFVGEVFHLLLSPALIVGWGPLPRLGIGGAALGVVASYGIGCSLVGGFLLSRHSVVRLRLRHLRIGLGEARAILVIGGPAALSAVLFWSTGFFTTALVGQLGDPALVAYGIGTRLDIVQYPLIFGFSTAVATMVATAIGAGRPSRAVSVTWTGCIVGAVIGAAFATVAFSGGLWLCLFTSDPEIELIGATYLLCQAFVYPIFGAGLAGVFASVAAGNVRLPLLTTTLRLILAVVGGWVALKVFMQPLAVFVAVAAAGTIYGTVMLVGVAVAGKHTWSTATDRCPTSGG
jgi:Na+-driven multidrug efflux pump